MNGKIPLLLITGLLLMASGCSAGTGTKAERVVPVKVYRVSERERQDISQYIGTVQPEKTVRLSFKTGGRVESIKVKKGDAVKKGDVLISLDRTDLLYAENLAKAQLEMVMAQYEKASNGATEEDIEQARLNVVKAEEAYNYALERFREAEELYHKGTVTKQAYEQAELEVKLREADLKLVREVQEQVQKGARYEEIKALSAQVESAKTEYDYRRNQLNEAVLKSPVDGTVLEILCEEGEMAAAGYPVIVLYTGEKIVSVGVPERELKNIRPETEVWIEKDGRAFEAKIKNIAVLPDSSTGLYNIEIECGEPVDEPFGSTVTVNFLVGNVKGCFVPLAAILNDGTDYVLTVSGDRAVRKNVTIEGIYNFEAMVTGLSDGELLIVSGINRLSTGDRVTVKEVDYGTDN
ncbi:efflux transporter, RND family, MFP subunit [Thermoclostridium stercorarium subsp. stercorarium DSM 8532]|uniref:Efflux transporter, RND family, MFP subunit n=2 Tax=Thermoclostridium stercorarium TaxID=1510 RepID=L7VIW4_THES1|nr:efflux RND transporter periplasmic adaptor subunit [Thermoclostridium stercorarium]AGC68020.1 efflux transporter, RND family, MFP subunit [Thermoclostridium stercorarium subsp. stercorarium DSM 8532]AGI39053.1 efflux transporter [Thermoclostridium stercorarium subsp. stercorarium DSM 8532]ANW98418.1 efflux transporter periplasmic adaptor subunit [Thermoclostridium stercorarium subsp. thermolacticum DSM 2910]UZQ86560.1 efflux RND transporter periplasmic adaptor subunit [Thermoclostridium ster